VITIVRVRGCVSLQHGAERETSKTPTLVHNSATLVGHKELKKAETELSDLVREVPTRTPSPDIVALPVDVETVDMVGGRGQARPGVEQPGHQRVSGNAGWRDASPDGSSAEEDVTVVVGDRGGGVDQTAMNGGFKLFTTKSSRTGVGRAIVQRLVQAHDGQTTIENAAGGIRATVVYPSVVRRALA
jgi:hypothetical protein